MEEKLLANTERLLESTKDRLNQGKLIIELKEEINNMRERKERKKKKRKRERERERECDLEGCNEET